MVKDGRLTLRLNVERRSSRNALIERAKTWNGVRAARNGPCFIQGSAIRRVVDHIIIDSALATRVFGIVVIELNIPIQRAAGEARGETAHAVVDPGFNLTALVVVIPNRYTEEGKLGR